LSTNSGHETKSLPLCRHPISIEERRGILIAITDMRNQRPTITCRQLIAYLADYPVGELDAVARIDFKRHLERCGSCQAYVQMYRETAHLAHSLATDDPVPDDVPEDLMRAILARVS
jgi:hypothetical protein